MEAKSFLASIFNIKKNLSLGSTWGYTSSMGDSSKIMSAHSLKRMLADCMIRNMVLLANVGPDRHGQIPKAESNVLLEMGRWLHQVGDAVYGTRGGPWDPKDDQYGFTYKGNTIYVYLLEGYKENTFTLPGVNKGQQVVKANMVENKKQVKARQNNAQEIALSGFDKKENDIAVIAVELNKNVMN